MLQPFNMAAQMIVSAQSILTDLMTQYTEIQTAMGKQQAFIDSLRDVAVWEEPTDQEPPLLEPEIQE